MEVKVLALTMGDPSGIGPEIVARTAWEMRGREDVIPLVVGDRVVVEEALSLLGLDLEVEAVTEGEVSSLRRNEGRLYLLDCALYRSGLGLEKGKVSPTSGRAAFEFIRRGVELCRRGLSMALVTAPINKEAIKAAGIPFIGHTEMLMELGGVRRNMTMFVVDGLKIFFHSRHVSLRRAIEELNAEGLHRSILMACACMRALGFSGFKLAVAALNPHASDGGLLGDEESLHISPAVERARADGLDVVGPIPADSVFHMGLTGVFDAVLSLYHDQGHIAAKTYDFYRTVSVTLGMSFLRTSVDHGTAFDIAWKGLANHTSMLEATLKALELAPRYDQTPLIPLVS